MKTEQEIKDKMEKLLRKSFKPENKQFSASFQTKAEALSWVLEMSAEDFDNFWDDLREGEDA